MSTDFDELLEQSNTELKPRMMTKKEHVMKSIVNILADEVIKEPMEPAKHRRTNHITSKTLTRRSNLRHALAGEKSKKILENDERTSSLTKGNLSI